MIYLKPTTTRQKRLYTVTISQEIVVVAEDSNEAREVAEDAISDLYDWDIDDRPLRHLPGGWGLEAIPFGESPADDPDRTIAKWIEAGAGEEYRKTKKWVDDKLAAVLPVSAPSESEGQR